MPDSTTPKIESNDLNLEDLFKDFYCVSDFQQEYVWENEHVEKLLQDVQDEFYDEDNRLAGLDGRRGEGRTRPKANS